MSPLSALKAVFFDLDETLLDDDAAMREALARTCAALARHHAGVDAKRLADSYLAVSDDFWRNLGGVPRATGSQASNGLEIRTEVWGRALAAHDRELANLATEAAAIYAGERSATYRLFPDALPVTDALRERLFLAVITNGPGDTQREKLERTGLAGVFQAVLISGELGVGKPDPAIFRLALAAGGFEARQAIHVGDSLEADVAGARAAGIATAWVNRTGRTLPSALAPPDIEIRSLLELKDSFGPATAP